MNPEDINKLGKEIPIHLNPAESASLYEQGTNEVLDQHDQVIAGLLDYLSTHSELNTDQKKSEACAELLSKYNDDDLERLITKIYCYAIELGNLGYTSTADIFFTPVDGDGVEEEIQDILLLQRKALKIAGKFHLKTQDEYQSMRVLCTVLEAVSQQRKSNKAEAEGEYVQWTDSTLPALWGVGEFNELPVVEKFILDIDKNKIVFSDLVRLPLDVSTTISALRLGIRNRELPAFLRGKLRIRTEEDLKSFASKVERIRNYMVDVRNTKILEIFERSANQEIDTNLLQLIHGWETARVILGEISRDILHAYAQRLQTYTKVLQIINVIAPQDKRRVLEFFGIQEGGLENLSRNTHRLKDVLDSILRKK